MRGFLKKRGQQGLAKWRRRYFKRDGDKLYYFIDQEDLKPRGAIDLLVMTSVELIADDGMAGPSPQPDKVGDGDDGPIRFRITTPGREFELEAETAPMARIWVKSLQEWKLRYSTMSRGVPAESGAEDGPAVPSAAPATSLQTEYELYERSLSARSQTDSQVRFVKSL